MTLIEYKHHNFNAASMATIETANEILAEYRAQGYTMTLRQLYYQFVAKALIENSERSYKNLGNLISKGRLAGLVSWRDLSDETRSCSRYSFEEDEREIVNGLEFGLNFDQWARQDHYVEVWIEKQALFNVIARPCQTWRVPHMACKGYLSQSEAWRAGQRFEAAIAAGKAPVLIHLGDHDPSGMDMTRDNRDRLEMFANAGVDVRRLALNMDQVNEHNPPPNPTKITDSRAGEYLDNYGSECWELDALQPRMIDDLVSEEIQDLIDHDLWSQGEATEYDKRKRLAKIHDNWDEIANWIDEQY